MLKHFSLTILCKFKFKFSIQHNCLNIVALHIIYIPSQSSNYTGKGKAMQILCCEPISHNIILNENDINFTINSYAYVVPSMESPIYKLTWIWWGSIAKIDNKHFKTAFQLSLHLLCIQDVSNVTIDRCTHVASKMPICANAYVY